ncbi:MAG: YicC family protein [Proteobacteria bacterium]|nr:YicC family protein [Pseudomonadota bacterium]MBU1138624.1 YicC family protein [Pseudomonadota bacterium]MBU1233070.1 YicC family protein [Pseudomonadota bacterium]MBU1419234.1 YicC family protein [Pseudomonadota bacterium]MBU1453862.1 YicC family protein [Pseudomonadota bacterium]
MSSKSMTGFGRGEAEVGGRMWTVEIRCVNHRYLDLKIKLPKGYAGLEERVRKEVAATLSRGRVDVLLSVTGDFSDLLEMRVNTSLATIYRDALASLGKALDLTDDTTLSQLASYPDILAREQREEDLEAVWSSMEPALQQALVACDIMRSEEGDAMARDLQERLDHFSQVVQSIEAAIPELLQRREQNLKERLQKLLDNVQLDPQRLAQEIAILADKTDVTEEIVRLHSHINQFRSFLEAAEATGRKIDFLLQEFLREVNTMASKINDASIAYLTVELKSELEKMREQIQNIE